MDLKQYYEHAISLEDYISKMETHQDNLKHVYNNFELRKDNDLSELKDKNLRILVITEDWCGDAMVNVPILKHIAEEINAEIKVVYRDQNVELMDQYLTNGGRSIPIFIYMNENFEELGVWGPRAASVQQLVDDRKALLPDKDTAEFKAAQQEYINDLTEQYRSNETLWNEIYESIRASLVKVD